MLDQSNLSSLILQRMTYYQKYEEILDTPGLALWFNLLVLLADEDRRTLDKLSKEPWLFRAVMDEYNKRMEELERRIAEAILT